MPLIRAIKAFVDQRLDTDKTYGGGTFANMPYADQWRLEPAADYGRFMMFVVLLICLPVVLFLVVVGLVYEGVIRIDRRPLVPRWLHWAVSLAVVTVAVAAAWQLWVSEWLASMLA